MRDSFKEHEIDFKEWCEGGYDIPALDSEKKNKIKQLIIIHLRNTLRNKFPPPPHQARGKLCPSPASR